MPKRSGMTSRKRGVSAGVPVAAGVLFPVAGILISPMFAAFAMSASSISVVLNALRLRAVKI